MTCTSGSCRLQQPEDPNDGIITLILVGILILGLALANFLHNTNVI